MALQNFKALTGISKLSFQFYHRLVQPSLQFRWWLAAPLSAVSHAAQTENSQVVLGLGRQGEMGSFSQLNLPPPTGLSTSGSYWLNRTNAKTKFSDRKLFWGVCSSWTFIGSIPAQDTCVYKHSHSHLLLFHQLGKQGSQGIKRLDSSLLLSFGRLCCPLKCMWGFSVTSQASWINPLPMSGSKLQVQSLTFKICALSTLYLIWYSCWTNKLTFYYLHLSFQVERSCTSGIEKAGWFALVHASE